MSYGTLFDPWALIQIGFFAAIACPAIAAALYSRSPHLRDAALILTFNWVACLVLWFIDRGSAKWSYTVADLVTMLYFYRRWSQPNPQHRQFHLILMMSMLVTLGLSAFQFLFRDVLPAAVSLSARWYQFIDNILFVGEFLFVAVYALLFRRAKANPEKWKNDTARWLSHKNRPGRSVDDIES